jgi:hypothetical protein
VIPDAHRPHRVRLDIIRVPVAGTLATEEWPAEFVDDTDPEPHHPYPVATRG